MTLRRDVPPSTKASRRVRVPGDCGPSGADSGVPVRRLYGHLSGNERECIRPSPPPLTRLIVGSVPDVMAEAPGPAWDRRLELPFALEVAAA